MLTSQTMPPTDCERYYGEQGKRAHTKKDCPKLGTGKYPRSVAPGEELPDHIERWCAWCRGETFYDALENTDANPHNDDDVLEKLHAGEYRTEAGGETA